MFVFNVYISISTSTCLFLLCPEPPPLLHPVAYMPVFVVHAVSGILFELVATAAAAAVVVDIIFFKSICCLNISSLHDIVYFSFYSTFNIHTPTLSHVIALPTIPLIRRSLGVSSIPIHYL